MTTRTGHTIASGRLVRLREKQLEDARRDYQWRRDPELAAYDATRPLSVAFRTFVSTMADELQHPTSYRRSFAIEALPDERHIGNVMYYGYDPVTREAELGITIGDRDYWERGCGTEAVQLMLGYLFEHRGMHRVYLHTLTTNVRAQTAFARAGFRRSRTVKRDGHSFELMDIQRDDYDPDGSRTQTRLPGRICASLSPPDAPC